MKKKLKKLDLNAETLRNLETQSLEPAAGGVTATFRCTLCTNACSACHPCA
jgi:hypothetical protein